MEYVAFILSFVYVSLFYVWAYAWKFWNAHLIINTQIQIILGEMW